MESLSDHQIGALAKFYGTSPERLRAGLEAEELFASRPELSVSAMRELGRNGELAEIYPNFANLIPNLSDGEINRWRENPYSLQLLRRLVENDVYLPRTYEEIAELVGPEALARLDPRKEYGVQWYNRQRVNVETVSVPDGKGGRRYKKRRKSVWRPREEWVAVPIPAHLDRAVVECARAMAALNRGAQRKHLAREWELRGLMRCPCGLKMATQTTRANANRGCYPYHYL